MNIEPVRCIAHVFQLIVKNVIDIVDEGEKDENSKFSYFILYSNHGFIYDSY
jgi:hypothetical protein